MNIKQFLNEHKFLINNKITQLNKRTKISILSGIILCTILSTILITLSTPDVYQVLIAGKKSGYITDKSVINDTLKQIKKDYKNKNAQISVNTDKISCEPTDLDKKAVTPLTVKKLEKKILASDICTLKGWAINISGKTVAAVTSKKEAQTVLANVKNHFLTKDSNVIASNFKEKVMITQAAIHVSDLVKPDKAVLVLLSGEKKPESYTVKDGDTIWGIASENGTTVDELEKANPGFDPNQIKIGQQLNLYALKPYVTVQTRELVSSTEKIDFNTVYEESGSLYKGEIKIKTAGVYGSKNVTSEITKENGTITGTKIIKSITTAEPQTQIALKGTKSEPVYVATRGQKRSLSISASGSQIVAYAEKFIGVPYSHGGSTPEGFDCSGFTRYVYENFGASLPHSSASQYSCGTTVNKSQLQPGDLIFFSNSSNISHVGIYVGGGKFIHSPQTGDHVKISSFSSSNLNYCGAVRIAQ